MYGINKYKKKKKKKLNVCNIVYKSDTQMNTMHNKVFFKKKIQISVTVNIIIKKIIIINH
jgi:hypothetical protein